MQINNLDNPNHISLYPITPSRYPVAITLSDTADIRTTAGEKKITKGIYVGGAGNIVAVLDDDSTVTFYGAVAGSVIPVQIKRVNATTTTATNLIALF